MEPVQPAREFGQAAQHSRNLLEPPMERGGALEIQNLAGLFTLAFDVLDQLRSSRFQTFQNAANLGFIFLLCAPREARRQTHLHLGIHTPRETWVRTNLDLAAADLE